MGDKNNNLEDFLRRKFSDIEKSEGAWTKPSLTVKNDILNQITEPTRKKRKRILLFFIFLLGALNSIGLFKFFLEKDGAKKTILRTELVRTDVDTFKTKPSNDPLNSFTKEPLKINSKSSNVATKVSTDELIAQNALLRTVIQNQNDIIIQLKEENLAAQKNSNKQGLENTLSENKLQKEFKALLRKNNLLEVKQEELKALNKVQYNEIELLKYEKKILTDSLSTQIYALNRIEQATKLTPKERSTIACQNVKPIVAIGVEATEVVVEPIVLEDNLGLDEPKRKAKFEVGYQLGMRGRITEVIEYIDYQGTITNQVKEKLLVSHVHGLNIGISPVKNFWIKTGAHVGNINLNQGHKFKSIYNSNSSLPVKVTAYTDKINSFSQKAINTLQENIGGLANAQNVVNGDELILNFQSNLVLTYLQIPLEFNYMYGKKRLKGLFQLGGQWNLLNYQYYIHGFQTKINNQNNTGFDKSASKVLLDESSIQYFGVHTGVGLSYNISKHWNIQGLLSYEYYFHYKTSGNPSSVGAQALASSVSSKVPSAIFNMGFGVKLGLNYRF